MVTTGASGGKASEEVTAAAAVVDTTGANALEAVKTGDGERREVAAAEEMDTWGDKEKRGVASAEEMTEEAIARGDEEAVALD